MVKEYIKIINSKKYGFFSKICKISIYLIFQWGKSGLIFIISYLPIVDVIRNIVQKFCNPNLLT